jgi:hypothetical protein
MITYTRERDCVWDAVKEFSKTRQQQLIFRKGRKYVYVAGELTKQGEPFKNIFGQTLHYPETSDIRKEYKSKGYELRGWVNARGSFKNN